MKNRILRAALIAMSGLTLTCTALAEGDPKTGRNKFYTCTGCHAIPGYTNAYPTYHVPRLGGQHAAYVVAALKAYKAGQRGHDTMHANASGLSDQDMEDIGAYVASFEPIGEQPPVTGSVKAGEGKSQTCQACHGADGNSDANPTYPRLAGQYEDYLRKALQDYKSGARNNAVMNGMAVRLSDQDIADLAAYYSSRETGLAVIRD
jgi:cytochrome c553